MVPGTVVVSHNGLCSCGKALINIAAQRQDLLGHPHGGDSQFSVADGKIVVDNESCRGQQGFQRSRDAYPEDLPQDLRSRQQIVRARGEQRFFPQIEAAGDRHARCVAQDRSDRCAADPESQKKNEDRIQDDIDDRTDDHTGYRILNRAFAAQELSEGIVSHGKETPGQNDLHVLRRESEGVFLRAQPPDDRRKKGQARGSDDQAVEYSQGEACGQSVPGFFPVFRPQAPRDQRRSPGAHHVGDSYRDHHHRIGEVDSGKLIIVPHQADKVGVHQIIENHNEHTRDQRNAHLHHSLRRLFLPECVYPPVPLFFVISFSVIFCMCTICFRSFRSAVILCCHVPFSFYCPVF